MAEIMEPNRECVMNLEDYKKAPKGSQRHINYMRRAWEDYKRGRSMRKREEKGKAVPQQMAKPTDADRTQAGAPRSTSSSEQKLGNVELPSPSSDMARHQPERKGRQGWKNTGGEYPWRIERNIAGDGNWRGTWILEVKNMFDVEWNSVKVFDGRKWRLESIPHAHWPFPYESLSRTNDGPSGEVTPEGDET